MLSWPHKDMEGLLGWDICSNPERPSRQHEHIRRSYTPFTHPFILTGRIWKDDYDGQMLFGNFVGLKLPDTCLKGGEKHRKNSPRKLVPTGDRTRARCVKSAHATACSTAVDKILLLLLIIIIIIINMDNNNNSNNNNNKIETNAEVQG